MFRGTNSNNNNNSTTANAKRTNKTYHSTTRLWCYYVRIVTFYVTVI